MCLVLVHDTYAHIYHTPCIGIAEALRDAPYQRLVAPILNNRADPTLSENVYILPRVYQSCIKARPAAASSTRYERRIPDDLRMMC